MTHPSPLPALPVACFANPGANRMTPYGARRSDILGADALAQAQHELSQWPGYAATPLHSLPALARPWVVAAVHYKDEGSPTAHREAETAKAHRG